MLFGPECSKKSSNNDGSMGNLSNNITLLQIHISPLFKVCLSPCPFTRPSLREGSMDHSFGIFVFHRKITWMAMFMQNVPVILMVGTRSYGGTPSKINM